MEAGLILGHTNDSAQPVYELLVATDREGRLLVRSGRLGMDAFTRDARRALLPHGRRLILEQALRAYTINGAYPLRMDDEIGSPSVGKEADLVVLWRCLFDVSRDPHRPGDVDDDGRPVHVRGLISRRGSPHGG